MDLLKAITRPSRLRAKLAEERRHQLAEGGEPVEAAPQVPAEVALQDALAVREMLQSKGWAVVRARLLRANARLWKDFVNPSIQGSRAEMLRLQALKYSGIEDVIEEILKQGEAIQRSKT